jgi:hypothetical protein
METYAMILAGGASGGEVDAQTVVDDSSDADASYVEEARSDSSYEPESEEELD